MSNTLEIIRQQRRNQPAAIRSPFPQGGVAYHQSPVADMVAFSASEAKPIPALASLGVAMAAAVTTVNFTHPIELCKTRMQVGNFDIKALLKNEGAGALWKGIQAAWLREASNTTVKLGGYGPVKKAIGAGSKDAPFWKKVVAGAISGTMGACTGNPFDVMKTMGMANAKEKQPLFKLMGQMYSQQGIKGFYRGLSANIARAIVLNGTKMAFYDEIKSIVVRRTGWLRTDLRVQFTSGIGAGFIMSAAVSPLDHLRTKMMNQPTDRKIYAGFSDCFVKCLKADGPVSFYRGFPGIWGRAAPHSTLQLVLFDNFLRLAGYNTV